MIAERHESQKIVEGDAEKIVVSKKQIFQMSSAPFSAEFECDRIEQVTDKIYKPFESSSSASSSFKCCAI